jgi:hypothetical protein
VTRRRSRHGFAILAETSSDCTRSHPDIGKDESGGVKAK